MPLNNLPQFLKNTKSPERIDLLNLKTNVVSWPKIHHSLPPEHHPRERERMLKQYLIEELRGFRRKHILLRVFGALAQVAEYSTEERKEYKAQLFEGFRDG